MWEELSPHGVSDWWLWPSLFWDWLSFESTCPQGRVHQITGAGSGPEKAYRWSQFLVG